MIGLGVRRAGGCDSLRSSSSQQTRDSQFPRAQSNRGSLRQGGLRTPPCFREVTISSASETAGTLPRPESTPGALASSAPERRPPEATLATLLYDHRVSWEVLDRRYGPLLELVRTLLGVVPNCDRYLEIWEPAFRTYNVMVPNFLNLPFSVLGVGGAPADVVGLGMYVVSRVSECPYCSAHSCSFALRRGSTPEKMAEALLGGSTKFDRGELATIAVARALGRTPCELTREERDGLIEAYGPDRAE